MQANARMRFAATAASSQRAAAKAKKTGQVYSMRIVEFMEHTKADMSGSADMYEPMVATNPEKFGDTSAIMTLTRRS